MRFFLLSIHCLPCYSYIQSVIDPSNFFMISAMPLSLYSDSLFPSPSHSSFYLTLWRLGTRAAMGYSYIGTCCFISSLALRASCKSGC